MNPDIAGKEYWDQVWSGADLPPPLMPKVKSLGNWTSFGLHRFFSEALASRRRPGAKLLEVGCASSQWLPYFSRELGFDVSGLDYSEVGCSRANALLRREGITGEIVCADFFSPPAALVAGFDVVVSLGVVEHFRPTVDCVRAISRFVRPGGLMATVIPNFSGPLGHLQRWVDREVYDKHVLLSAPELARAHSEAGLRVVRSGYLFFAWFMVVNFRRAASSRAVWLLAKTAAAASRACALIEDTVPAARPNQLFSPYAYCLAEA